MSSIEIVTKEDLLRFKHDLLAEIKTIIDAHQTSSVPQMLKSYEVKKRLNLSNGTLTKLRQNGTIPYTMVGDEPRYSEVDILQMLERNKPSKK
ncbi:hypothetical protein GA0116948_11047 [Chitinophaga costaii]|uniref:Helix-turn-helix domain-containing protein n=1 Tax=Chitinophaga costaii TaxID=1335309 RepID=A0A1C4EW08_9BACT|nr:helix-turn-helix domain-containing protein [Chitinophaga costaii]PUZ21612.1 DNA-binding protein [Chitinophaga costaii]SCC47760.1 hypothetical protein GA0116948_11047 [Chitinophaga costaii]